MDEVKRIRRLLRQAIEGPAWHGPSVREALAGIDARAAAARPVAGAHSIWELVHHVVTWQEVVAERLAGRRLADLPPEEDWPAVADGAGEAAWQRTLAALDAGHRRLLEAIAGLPAAALDDEMPLPRQLRHTVADMLHGLVAHHVYHAGQIGLLRRAAAAGAVGAVGAAGAAAGVAP